MRTPGEVGVLSLGRGKIRLLLCPSVHCIWDVAREQRVFLGHPQCWGMVRIGMGREEVDLTCWDLIQKNLGRDLGEYWRMCPDIVSIGGRHSTNGSTATPLGVHVSSLTVLVTVGCGYSWGPNRYKARVKHVTAKDLMTRPAAVHQTSTLHSPPVST
jgi:hypothetical protein